MLVLTVALACGGAQHEPIKRVELPTPTATATSIAPISSVHAVAQTGPRGEVWALAWSPRGDLLAMGSFDHTIRIWNDRGVMLGVLRGHREALTDLAFSPRGDVLASAARDGTVRLWDLHHAGKHLKLDHAGDHLAFDATGERVVSVGYDLHARVWNVASGAIERTLDAPRGRQLRGVAWSGARIVAVALDGPLFVWSTDTWQRTVDAIGGRLERLRFSPDGSVLAGAGGNNGSVVLFDVATMARRELSHADVEPSALCFSPDGKTLVTNGSFGQVHVWNVATGAHQKTFAHAGYNEAIACAPNDARVAVGGKVPTVSHVEVPTTRVYDIASSREVLDLDGARPIEHAEWDDRGETLMTEGAEVALWSASTGAKTGGFAAEGVDVEWNPRRSLFASVKARAVSVVDANGAPYGLIPFTGETRVAWSPDGETLAIWNDSSVTLWSAAKRTKREIAGAKAKSFVSGVAFDPESREIAIASGDDVDAYTIATGQLARTYAIKGHTQSWHRAESIVFGPHGELAATVNGPGALLFDATGAFTADVPDRSWFALPAFSADGRTVAYATGHDVVLRGALGDRFHGHDDVVRSIAWSPDGRSLASSSDDQTVRVWRPRKPQPSAVFDTYDGRVWSVAWHPRGKALLGVGNEALIHRLQDHRTLHMLVTPGATAAAWFTEDGAFAGDERALSLAVLREGDDLLDPKLGQAKWTKDPTLLSDL